LLLDQKYRALQREEAACSLSSSQESPGEDLPRTQAMVGALLGFHRLVEAALWTAGLGGLIAAGFLGVRALRRALGWTTSPTTKQGTDQESIPYAPAIALGVWLSLVPKG